MYYTQIAFPLFVIAAIANIVLALTVLRYAPRNISRYLFVFFILAQLFWISANFVLFRTTEAMSFLFMTRLTVFFAALHAFTFFLFIYSFLESRNVFTRKLLIPLSICLTVVLALILSPYVFTGTTIDDDGSLVPLVGPGIVVFGLFVSFCILYAFVSMVKKYRRATGIEKRQWKYLAFGLTFTFFLILSFSFFNFVLFGNLATVEFGHLYTLPFVIFTAYAMVRHQLFHTKVIIAELSVVLLVLILILQLVNSDSFGRWIISAVVFTGTLIVGGLLIRGVYQEVSQREQLQRLTDDLAKANKELRRLDRAKSEFISIASHQLRTPLTAMKGYLSLILEDNYGKLADALQKPVARVYQSNERLISLVNDLLSLSRIESGKMKLEPRETDIEDVIQSVIEELRIKAEQKELRLVLEKPQTEVPKMMVDPEKIRNAILNVVDNSIRYTNEGSIIIKLEVQKKRLRIIVQDTGAGMTQEEMRELFESFSRGEAGEKLSTEGVGLGLYIAKQFVEMHKGKIWAESPGKGQGSTFYIELPLATRPLG